MSQASVSLLQCDPLLFSAMHQEGSSSENLPSIRIKDDPDDAPSFPDFHLNPERQSIGPPFLQSSTHPHNIFTSNEQTQYAQGFAMHDFTKALDESSSMIDHPSPESDTLSLDDNDSMFSSASPPDAYDGQLPPYEETERYLRLTLGINPPQAVNLTALPETPWPPGITRMIKLAIWGSQRKMLTLSQIYEEIEKRFPSKRSGKDAPWKKSIRHNLSLKSVFVKVERPANHPGKGCYWALDFRRGEGDKRPRSRKVKEAGTWNPEGGSVSYGSARGPHSPYGSHVPLYPAAQAQASSSRTLMLPSPEGFYYPQAGSSIGQSAYNSGMPMDYGVRAGPPFAAGPQMRWPPTNLPFPADFRPTAGQGFVPPGYGGQPLGDHYPRQGSELTHPYHGGQAFASSSTHSLQIPANPPAPVLPPRSYSYTRYEEDAKDPSKGSHRHRTY